MAGYCKVNGISTSIEPIGCYLSASIKVSDNASIELMSDEVDVFEYWKEKAI